MPATRSAGHHPRAQPFTLSISSSSSDAESSSAPLAIRKKSKPKPSVPVEVIEISDDDDDDNNVPARSTGRLAVPQRTATPEPAAIAEYRRQVGKYRTDSAKYKRDFELASKKVEALQAENERLQSQISQKPSNGKIILDASKLSDNLDCEICTARMWTPYLLPDCGHTFCMSCLQDWFKATKNQFNVAHPQFNGLHQHNINQIYQIVHLIANNPAAGNHPHLPAMVAQLLPPQPQYTCPTCREPVKTKPTESFALKSIVRTVTEAMGERSPRKTGLHRPGKGPNNAPGPWDAFFPN